MRSLYLTLLVVTISLIASAQSTKPVDLHTVTEAVDKHYNSLNSLETQFVEDYRGGGMTRSESGTMWIKKPGKMLWQYTSPRQKLFVTDGKSAWFYVPGEKQARRAGVKNLDDLRSPLRYLLGHSKLEKEFKGLSIAVDKPATVPGAIVLRGIPKGMEDRIEEVILEIADGNRIARIHIEELDGSSTDFRLQGEKDNVQIEDAKFKFVPPQGVEVIQGEGVNP